MSKQERVSLREAIRNVIESRQELPFQGEFEQEPSTSTAVLSETPCFETFLTHLSESQALEKFDMDVRVGDALLVKVKRFDAAGAYVRPLCTMQRIKRDLEWLDMQILVPISPLQRRFSVGEKIIVDVIGINPMRISIREAPSAECVTPPYFRISREVEGTPFWKWISRNPEANNPYLEGVLKIPERNTHSFLNLDGLEQVETAAFLRKRQDRNAALELVAKGVEALKDGYGLTGAIPLFTKALSCHPECVEAYVARGAAYANEDKLDQAVEDLETALGLDKSAKNAATYLYEVLLKLSSRLKEDGSQDEAIAKLTRCLELRPDDDRVYSALAKLGIKRLNAHQTRSPSVEIVDDRSHKISNGNKRQNSIEKDRDDQKRPKEGATEEEKRINREKLQEFERLIAAMKGN